MRVKDLVGSVFGRLTVVERRGSRSGYANYLCRCICAPYREIETTSHALQRGYAKSCGCLRREWVRHNLFMDLTGKSFGRLRVIRYLGPHGGINDGAYLCQCVCGSEVKVLSKNLRKGNTQSCGCLQRERTSSAKRYPPYKALYNSLLYKVRLRKLAIDISFEDFLGYVEQESCHYCGDRVAWAKFNGGNKAYNLDRKDNDLGYLKSNTVVACGRCNRGKADRFSYEEWVCMAAALQKMRSERKAVASPAA